MSITEVDGLVAQSIEASVALVRQGKQIDSDGGGAVDIAALSRLGEVAGAAASGVDIKFSIESAFRDRLCSVLSDVGTDICRRYPLYYGIMDATFPFVHHGLCDDTLTLLLLEDCVNIHLIEECEQLFSYLESRQERVASNVTGTRGRGLVLLRICNELVRRLSPAENAGFRGRVLVYLAHIFRLSERSGVNLRGDYHVDNRTVIEPVPQGEMDVDAVNLDFYTTLWSLQEYFANPPLVYSTPDILPTLYARMSKVLEQFGEARKSPKYLTASRDDLTPDRLTPTYLSSRKLLDLELHDAAFQAQVLIQMLVFLEHLASLSTERKAKWSTIATPNRSVLVAFTLPDQDKSQVKELMAMVHKLLQIPYGCEQSYAELVDCALQSDRNWVKWKQENCPAIELARFEDVPDRREKLAPKLKPIRMEMGTLTLSRLWKLGGDVSLEALRDPRYSALPSVTDGLPELAADDAAISEATTDEERDHAREIKASRAWRCLRVGARLYLRYFNAVGEGDVARLVEAEKSRLGKASEAEAVGNDDASTDSEEKEHIDEFVAQGGEREDEPSREASETDDKGNSAEGIDTGKSESRSDVSDDKGNDEIVGPESREQVERNTEQEIKNENESAKDPKEENEHTLDAESEREPDQQAHHESKPEQTEEELHHKSKQEPEHDVHDDSKQEPEHDVHDAPKQAEPDRELEQNYENGAGNEQEQDQTKHDSGVSGSLEPAKDSENAQADSMFVEGAEPPANFDTQAHSSSKVESSVLETTEQYQEPSSPESNTASEQRRGKRAASSEPEENTPSKRSRTSDM